MKLLVTHEIHAKKINNRYFNPAGVIDYNALTNYMYKTDDLCLIVRCRPAEKTEDEWLEISGPGIEVRSIHEPFSVLQILLFLPGMLRSIIQTIKKCDRYLIRVPGPTGSLVGLILLILRRKYAVECAGHATESYIETRKGLLVKFKAAFHERLTSFLIRHAHCVGYRSQYLRRLYPNKNSQKEWIFSGAQLDEQMINLPRSRDAFVSKSFNLIYVGRLMPEKGLKTLLSVLKVVIASKTEREVLLHLVGDGRQMKELKSFSEELGISDSVIFHGRLDRYPGICNLLDSSQLFVLPSLTEGMPRSLIEAMARGIPALGSSAGGIVELLKPDCLFDPGNEDQLLQKILGVINDPVALEKMSQENYESAKEHWPDRLAISKEGFWREVMSECK